MQLAIRGGVATTDDVVDLVMVHDHLACSANALACLVGRDESDVAHADLLHESTCASERVLLLRARIHQQPGRD